MQVRILEGLSCFSEITTWRCQQLFLRVLFFFFFMVIHMNHSSENNPEDGMSTYVRSSDTHLGTLTRIVGVCTAIVVCGVGVDVAYRRHNMGLYVTASSVMIFFLEITWAITLFVQICVRNEESLCSYCWSRVLAITKGWRRALFYLPLSCILAWKPHKLGLSYVAAGLLAILSLLHIASSALGRRISCQSSSGTDSVGESLLNARPENYDRFEEVLVPEVLDDAVSGPTVRVGDSDGEI